MGRGGRGIVVEVGSERKEEGVGMMVFIVFVVGIGLVWFWCVV